MIGQQQFDSVDAVIYMSSLSEYDQQTYDGGNIPRLQDSIAVFETFYSEKKMANVPIYLVLNKLDVLKAKCKAGRKLSNFFTAFKGDDDNYEDYIQFIKEQFVAKDVDERIKDVFYTEAIDESSVRLLAEKMITSVLSSPPTSKRKISQ